MQQSPFGISRAYLTGPSIVLTFESKEEKNAFVQDAFVSCIREDGSKGPGSGKPALLGVRPHEVNSNKLYLSTDDFFSAGDPFPRALFIQLDGKEEEIEVHRFSDSVNKKALVN